MEKDKKNSDRKSKKGPGCEEKTNIIHAQNEKIEDGEVETNDKEKD